MNTIYLILGEEDQFSELRKIRNTRASTCKKGYDKGYSNEFSKLYVFAKLWERQVENLFVKLLCIILASMRSHEH